MLENRKNDFNIHLPPIGMYESEIESFDSLLDKDNLERLRDHASSNNVVSGNLMLFSKRLSSEDISKVNNFFPGFLKTALLDPYLPDLDAYVGWCVARDIKLFKFHPYFQRLGADAHIKVLEAARTICRHGGGLVICCSYGTKYLYAIDSLKLLTEILIEDFFTGPIVALHSGGRRFLDVMAIAQETPNLFLDTSFSVPFWEGSSVEIDIVFGLKTLGSTRFLYGSDFPYCSMEESESSLCRMMDQANFDEADFNNVFRDNYSRLRDCL